MSRVEQNKIASRRACNVCSETILRLMAAGERTFTPEQIKSRVYHRPCTGCQRKTGREFYCTTCDNVQRATRRSELVVTFANSSAPVLWDDSRAHGLSAEKPKQQDAPRQHRRREDSRLRNDIVRLLGEQVETYDYVDKDGRRRGTRARTKLMTNTEIAEKVECSPEYVGQIRAWFMRNDANGWDIDQDDYVQHQAIRRDEHERHQGEPPARRSGRPPTIAEAIALRERRFAGAVQSQYWQEQEREFKRQYKAMIGHSRRYFRRARTS